MSTAFTFYHDIEAAGFQGEWGDDYDVGGTQGERYQKKGKLHVQLQPECTTLVVVHTYILT